MFTDNERSFIKWYDYLWLLVPIAGIAMMVVVVTDRAQKGREAKN